MYKRVHEHDFFHPFVHSFIHFSEQFILFMRWDAIAIVMAKSLSVEHLALLSNMLHIHQAFSEDTVYNTSLVQKLSNANINTQTNIFGGGQSGFTVKQLP